MVNKATGNKWIEKCAATTVEKGSILGVLIDPVKGLVSVYINDKILPEAMPLSQAAVTALSDTKVCVRAHFEWVFFPRIHQCNIYIYVHIYM